MRPHLCVPLDLYDPIFIYLDAKLFTQELFVWYEMHTYVLSPSHSSTHVQKLSWHLKAIYSKQLVCNKRGCWHQRAGFGWGSVDPHHFKRKQVSVMCYWLRSHALWVLPLITLKRKAVNDDITTIISWKYYNVIFYIIIVYSIIYYN